jgi:uncharacterized phage infection (PIP) family protein YhgE
MAKEQDAIKTRIEITGEKEYKDAIKDINKNLSLMGSEMKLAAAQFADNAKSVDALKAKQDILNKTYQEQVQKVKAAEQMLEKYKQQGEKGADAARKMQIELNGFATAAAKTQNELNRTNKELEEAEKAMKDLGDESDKAEDGTKDLNKELKKSQKELDKTEKEAEETGSGFEKLGSTIASVGKGIGAAVLGIGATLAGLGAAVVGLVESTRETREEFNKLEAAFTSAGHTAQAAEKTYTEFYALLGDEGQATEAVSHLAKLTNNQKELATWTNIATGVFATFGDSLPIENLTEASNETAKTGQLTGGLADALNWAGVNEDKFQESLDACTSEQQRQALITETLNGLYSEAAAKYKTLNGDILDARKATAELTQATADMGAAFEPAVTAGKQALAGLLKEITPAIQLIGGGLSGAMTGTAGAAEQMKRGFAGLWDTLMTGAGEAIKGIAAALGKGITEGVPKLTAAASEMINTIGQGLVTGIPNFANKALDVINGFADMLTANLPTLIQAGISFVTNLAQGLVNALPDFIAKAPEIISKFANLINDNMPKILAVAVNIIVTLVKGLISAIPTLVANIPKIITAIVDVWSAFNWAQLGKNAIGFLRDGITSMIGAVKTAGTNILNTVKGAIQALPGNLKTIATNAMTNFKGAISGAVTSVWNAAKGVLDSVVGVFKDAPTKLLQAGKDLITGFWNGISEMGGWIANKVSDFFGGIVDNVKALLGIHSPSTVFAEIGGNMAAGVGVGFDENMGSTTSEMQSAIGGAGALTAQEAINAVNNGIISNIGQLSGAITAIVQAVMQGLNGQAAQFNVIGQGMAKNIAVGFVGGVVQIQAVVPQMVQSIITSFTVQHQKFVNEGREIDKNIAEGMVKNVSLITSRVGQIVTPIINAFQGYAPQFRQIGVDMVNNIWEGFSSMIDDLKANIQDAIDDIKNTVNNELGDINVGTGGGGYGERENPRTRSAPQPKPEKIQITQNIYANETSYAQQQREAAKQFKLIAREVGI